MVTRARTAVSALVATVALTACQVEPKLLSAQAQQSGDTVNVEVAIPSEDAATIKRRELYTYVRVGDCERMEDGYPAEAHVDGAPVSRFSFRTEGPTVKMSGAIPAHIFENYQAPCASLEGGGYGTGTLVSVPIPVKIGPGH